mmetsp:Transcript_23150/g.57583  ORF Transcript_23150/g.57583 Transcript_23150/m.57583 type:complete len:223 (+) Transcript_23150:1713-2381(+)
MLAQYLDPLNVAMHHQRPPGIIPAEHRSQALQLAVPIRGGKDTSQCGARHIRPDGSLGSAAPGPQAKAGEEVEEDTVVFFCGIPPHLLPPEPVTHFGQWRIGFVLISCEETSWHRGEAQLHVRADAGACVTRQCSGRSLLPPPPAPLVCVVCGKQRFEHGGWRAEQDSCLNDIFGRGHPISTEQLQPMYVTTLHERTPHVPIQRVAQANGHSGFCCGLQKRF